MIDRAARVSRRQLLHRLGCLAVGLPLLAACSVPAPAPTAAPTAGAKPTTPPAAPTTAPTVAPTAAAAAAQPTSSKPKAVIGIVQEPTSLDPTADATAS